MRPSFVIALTLVIGLAIMPLAAEQPTSKPSADAFIQAIQQAPDPSAVAMQYANSLALNKDNLGVNRAYVDRMVELGVPEMAFHQANLVVGSDPAHGTSWAVMAYVNARREQMPDALADIILAAGHAPDSTFVQRVAGELVAWYDMNTAAVQQLHDKTRQALRTMQTALKDKKAFADAYKQASDELAKAGASTNPAVPTESYSMIPYPSGQEMAGAYSAPQDMYLSVYNPYASAAGGWWWPSGSFFGPSFFSDFPFFFDRDEHHHHHHWNSAANSNVTAASRTGQSGSILVGSRGSTAAASGAGTKSLATNSKTTASAVTRSTNRTIAVAPNPVRSIRSSTPVVRAPALAGGGRSMTAYSMPHFAPSTGGFSGGATFHSAPSGGGFHGSVSHGGGGHR